MNSQRSLTDQLRELYTLANRNGLYDAADFLAAHLEHGDACVDCEALTDSFGECHGLSVSELPAGTVISGEHEEP